MVVESGQVRFGVVQKMKMRTGEEEFSDYKCVINVISKTFYSV